MKNFLSTTHRHAKRFTQRRILAEFLFVLFLSSWPLSPMCGANKNRLPLVNHSIWSAIKSSPKQNRSLHEHPNADFERNFKYLRRYNRRMMDYMMRVECVVHSWKCQRSNAKDAKKHWHWCVVEYKMRRRYVAQMPWMHFRRDGMQCQNILFKQANISPLLPFKVGIPAWSNSLHAFRTTNKARSKQLHTHTINATQTIPDCVCVCANRSAEKNFHLVV